MTEYTIKYIDLTNKDFEDFTGRIDIEKVDNQLFVNSELERLEKCFENLPVSITTNNTGVSLWLFDDDYTNDVMENVKAELAK